MNKTCTRTGRVRTPANQPGESISRISSNNMARMQCRHLRLASTGYCGGGPFLLLQMLHFAPEESDVGSALLQWRDDTLPYAVSVLLSVVMLGTRFLAPGGSLRRRRGRILLLPGGSLARLRSLAPRYVLSKVDDSDDEADGRSVDSPDYSSVGACSPPRPAHQETHHGARASRTRTRTRPRTHAPAPPPQPRLRPPSHGCAHISKTAGAYGVPTISSVSTVVL
ncbi:Protein of unknown function [Gryllus bimaculatus]|nr:Protein of unknown function [Gryllus bimaculatus]